MSDDLASAVASALAVDRDAFQARVLEDATVIKDALDDGVFDNPEGVIGLEIEFYAVVAGEDEPSYQPTGTPGALARVPRRLLEYVGFEKELGLHNAEMSTSPQPLNAYGLRAQESEVAARLSAARGPIRAEGLQLVSDGLWTIPPDGETTAAYLTDSVEDDGVQLAANMSDSARYHAMANAGDADFGLDAPHVSLDATTAMPESLITSIQPHYQVPHAVDLAESFNYALRVAGPLLAVGVNSPLFPPDLYDDGATATAILEDGWAENRIAVFESVLNTPDAEKVRFPRDLETTAEAVDRIAEDDTLVPLPVSTGDRFDDEFAHFRMKHGTYWRWVRPVFEGATRSSANARIEFRPLPAQPTIRDTVAFQAVFAGLLAGLRRQEHPVLAMDWTAAEDNFYAAVRDGLDADLEWIDRDGGHITDTAAILEDVLDHARAGLEAHGLSETGAHRFIEPLRERVAVGQTPAAWKREAVRNRLDDGASFSEAVHGMQREYIDRQEETLLSGRFTDWLQ